MTSSTSMKISSRSIHSSPGRTGYSRDPPPPISLSRRLTTSRSIKGAASPAMFPVTGKKRGCAFDYPEPSSPKVTCIGQVRVKSKNKHHLRRKLDHSRSQNQHLRCSNNGHQKWVHIPLTICEALRAFGSEVSCLFPCRSSNEKEEKMDVGVGSVEEGKHGSCSAVLARWLVALQDGDGDGRREIELVAGDDVRNSRRHVFDNLDIVNDMIVGSKDKGRVSICIPPKNALLLMRCRSDPMKMEALTNRFWEPPEEEIEEEEDEEFVDRGDKSEENKFHQEDFQLEDDYVQTYETFQDELEINSETEMEKQSIIQGQNSEMQEKLSLIQDQNFEMQEKQSIIQEEGMESSEDEESFFLGSLFEENTVQNREIEEEEDDDDDCNMEDAEEELFEDETETGESNVEKDQRFEEMLTRFTERCESLEEIEVENGDKALPECLLLMLYEPKLSMEVSKETWVCRSDFNRRHSARRKPPPPPQPQPVESTDSEDKLKVIGSDDVVTITAPVYCESVLADPGRSSCSFPEPGSVIEEKVVNTRGMVLTRCKSEPMRRAAETCYWLEPPRRASFGVSMRGLGVREFGS